MISALEEAGDGALAAALARNLCAGEVIDAAAPAHLARYVRAAWRILPPSPHRSLPRATSRSPIRVAAREAAKEAAKETVMTDAPHKIAPDASGEAPWSHVLTVSHLAPETTLTLEPSADTRATLARHVGALEVPELKATLALATDRKSRVEVTGRLTGRVIQACVVTLEPLEAVIDEEVAVRFSTDARLGEAEPGVEIELSVDAEDPPEPIVDGRIDLGAILTEFFSLGVDPYPRKPGAEWQPPADERDGNSPFAALAELKSRGPS